MIICFSYAHRSSVFTRFEIDESSSKQNQNSKSQFVDSFSLKIFSFDMCSIDFELDDKSSKRLVTSSRCRVAVCQWFVWKIISLYPVELDESSQWDFRLVRMAGWLPVISLSQTFLILVDPCRWERFDVFFFVCCLIEADRWKTRRCLSLVFNWSFIV